MESERGTKLSAPLELAIWVDWHQADAWGCQAAFRLAEGASNLCAPSYGGPRSTDLPGKLTGVQSPRYELRSGQNRGTA